MAWCVQNHIRSDHYILHGHSKVQHSPQLSISKVSIQKLILKRKCRTPLRVNSLGVTLHFYLGEASYSMTARAERSGEYVSSASVSRNGSTKPYDSLVYRWNIHFFLVVCLRCLKVSYVCLKSFASVLPSQEGPLSPQLPHE